MTGTPITYNSREEFIAQTRCIWLGCGPARDPGHVAGVAGLLHFRPICAFESRPNLSVLGALDHHLYPDGHAGLLSLPYHFQVVHGAAKPARRLAYQKQADR